MRKLKFIVEKHPDGYVAFDSESDVEAAYVAEADLATG